MNLINLIQYSEEVLQDKYYLFNDIVIPDGIDKEVLINTILDTSALATPLYTDAELMKQKIDNLFLKNKVIYERLLAAFNKEYDPISNYDRSEESTDEVSGSNSIENKISAYDSDNYQPDNSVSGSNVGTNKHTSKITGNIGVTTSQQMLESELNVRPKLNIYEVIANDFYNELMLYI